MNTDTFKKIVTFVINNLEGGYYHPSMLQDGRVNDTRYSTSGETMFGIDRLQGGSINTTPAGLKFWSAIDTSGASKNWQWNYMGGDLAPQLKDLAGEMILTPYTQYSNLWLTDKAKKLVESDDRLLFHFVYSTWNGPGWFQYFAGIFNNAVNSGVTDIEKLVGVAVNSRINSGNSLIAQGGTKIAALIDELKKKVPPVSDNSSSDNSNNNTSDNPVLPPEKPIIINQNNRVIMKDWKTTILGALTAGATVVYQLYQNGHITLPVAIQAFAIAVFGYFASDKKNADNK